MLQEVLINTRKILQQGDDTASLISENRTENAAGFQRATRHETWIKGIAKHVDYELTD